MVNINEGNYVSIINILNAKVDKFLLEKKLKSEIQSTFHTYNTKNVKYTLEDINLKMNRLLSNKDIFSSLELNEIFITKKVYDDSVEFCMDFELI